ncbi:MAG: DNA topoisomerase I [Gammaproteobacteria bacterium]|nr:DNA topoisomerase I [Gammaproteobacteria bacterium]MYD76890.1 DNA topoisomerase I [Gammaproteobacteria bacterium]
MSGPLIIVESPAKAKSITRYLGDGFKALASYGHVRDLLPKTGAVDPDRDFAMQYEIIEKNRQHVDQIAREMKKSDALYLATDPDREGEAISWHLLELLKEKNAIGDKPVYRVEFFEITPSAIQEAVKNPRDISANLVDAQLARRVLDYLVGFNLSPLLWKKIRTGLSAGRVQSPALRMICEREQEIEAFVAQEYWTVEADVRHDGQRFVARLVRYQGEKIEQFSITNEEQAHAVKETLSRSADGSLEVLEVVRKQKKRNPAPPFTTSTLQQEAARKLHFSTRKTMQVAQQLYEGIDIDGETAGLITYMRTDSVALASSALDDIRRAIGERYGDNMLPKVPRRFRTKTRNAQEAHEAIRPTSAIRVPDRMKPHLSSDQFRLYQLIWKRTVASQMTHAVIDTTTVDMAAGEDGVFRASGSTVRDPGFMSVYLEGQDDSSDPDAKEVLLPSLEKGMRLDLSEIRPEQHFTEPPPRYNEASLVKALETHGIGRPSTYSTIISTLQNRDYAVLDARRFKPTDTGKIVNKFLSEHFERYVDYEFTARMENELDAISRGEKEWKVLMKRFWEHFSKQVADKEESVTRAEVNQARPLGTDPKTGKPVSVRLGRFGPFAQIGSREDEEKPRFASLQPGQKLDTITLEEALGLFSFPRHLGQDPDGQDVSVNIGRYGPYVRCGKENASLGGHDPGTIDLQTALELVVERRQEVANRVIRDFDDSGIRILKGRFGPYVTDGKKNVTLPKSIENPESLSLDECRDLLKNAKPKARRGRGKRAAR